MTLGAFRIEVLAVQIAGVMSGIELIDPSQQLVDELAALGRELVSRFDAGAASPSRASSSR